MFYDILLLLLGAIISPILTRFFSIFKTKYQIEFNPEFYNLKVVKYALKIAKKIEPHLLKTCGIISFAAGIVVFISFLIIEGCIFYNQTFASSAYAG